MLLESGSLFSTVYCSLLLYDGFLDDCTYTLSEMPIQFANLLFANMTFRQQNKSPTYNLPTDISPILHFTNLQFANMTIRQHDISPT
jgi:hypothetical protein